MSSRSFREVSAVFLLHTVPNKIEVSSEANRMHCRLTTTEERLALEPLLVHLLELWSEYRVVYSTHELYPAVSRCGKFSLTKIPLSVGRLRSGSLFVSLLTAYKAFSPFCIL